MTPAFDVSGWVDLYELTGGRELIVGDIKILFRQTASADAFATSIPIGGYQFVAES